MGSWTFVILTFGCKVNQYESQAVREHWQAYGGVETEDLAQADIAFINSCAITSRAERDARAALYRLEREAPHCRRILSGCSAALIAADPKLRALCHAIFPVKDKVRLLSDPRLLLTEMPTTINAEQPCPPAISVNALTASRASSSNMTVATRQSLHAPAHAAPVTAGMYPPFSIHGFRRARPVLKVQDGCTHRCTYCIVPTARSLSASRPAAEVVLEAQRLLAAGYREIMISGINLLLYGRDFAEPTDFWSLIATLEKELAPEWAGRARLRISSLEPKQLQGRGLELLAESRMLCPHLHISLQSGSPAVLRRMGRGHYRPELLADALMQLSNAWPRFALGADILMGFPGEQEMHVRETLAVVEALPFTYAHVFPYSRRPGTAAASFPDQIPRPEKLARAARVRELIHTKQRAFWERTLREQPEMHLALDCTENCSHDTPYKGIDQCYTPCLLERLPQGVEEHALLSVRPIAISSHGLHVVSLQHE